MAQVDEALQAAADVILLDNMSTAEMTDAVRRIGGRAIVEASGGVTLDQVRAVAQTGCRPDLGRGAHPLGPGRGPEHAGDAV